MCFKAMLEALHRNRELVSCCCCKLKNCIEGLMGIYFARFRARRCRSWFDDRRRWLGTRQDWAFKSILASSACFPAIIVGLCHDQSLFLVVRLHLVEMRGESPQSVLWYFIRRCLSSWCVPLCVPSDEWFVFMVSSSKQFNVPDSLIFEANTAAQQDTRRQSRCFPTPSLSCPRSSKSWYRYTYFSPYLLFP